MPYIFFERLILSHTIFHFKKYFLKLGTVWLILFFSIRGTAQTESINTDRPDQSDGVYIIPKGRFQIEEGITLAKRVQLNNLMVRYGITNSTELRFQADLGWEDSAGGIKPITLSAKQRIIKQHKLIPAITLAGYIGYEKIASKEFRGKEIPFELKLIFEQELNKKFAISYNVGTSEKFKELDLTLNLGYTPSTQVSTFIEYFSSIQKSDAEHNVDIGILYLINPRLQIDLALGASVTNLKDRVYSTFGISYLFK